MLASTRAATSSLRPPAARSLGWFARAASAPPPPPAAAPAGPEDHDLVIVGGGPAGLTLAAALASSDDIAATHSITLIEGASLDSVRQWDPQPGEWSNRVSSITAENAHLLARAGIWQHVDATRTRPLDELAVWDGLSSARIEFTAPFLSASSSPAQPPPPSASPPAPGDAWDAAFASALRPRRAALSTMVENLNLQRAALRRIEQCRTENGTRIELLDASRVEGIERGEGGWPVVRVKGTGDAGEGRQLRARLLIGADGANSPVKSYSTIDTFGWAYDRQGIVATMSVDPLAMGEGMSTGWQRFLPEGPIAFLPLSDTHASLVWSTTPAYAALIKSLPLDVLPHLVTAAFTIPYEQLRAFLDSILPPPAAPDAPAPPPPTFDSVTLIDQLKGMLLAYSQATYDPSNPSAALPPAVSSIAPRSVASFPLRLSHTSSYLGLPSSSPSSAIAQDLRTALVGDAAHTVHPLAGQGLNLGLADAFSLSALLARRARQGADLGAYLSLKEYPRERYFANHKTLSACDHLASLYARTDAPSVWIRSQGLEVLNELEPLKRLIMGQAGSGSGSGGGGAKRERSAGPWGAVASALEGVSKAKDLVGLVGGALVGQAGRRAADFIVKGR
ncbi:putative N,N-dimethylaniline monooxygenase COQ6 [Rhodotorula paludigena]|uniref:putative N,N-dimethylaniline monooxygenase COQ6 n=1 Tax=Rhodotorula paludigena TaxID=86838 RepID=UPI00317145D3